MYIPYTLYHILRTMLGPLNFWKLPGSPARSPASLCLLGRQLLDLQAPGEASASWGGVQGLAALEVDAMARITVKKPVYTHIYIYIHICAYACVRIHIIYARTSTAKYTYHYMFGGSGIRPEVHRPRELSDVHPRKSLGETRSCQVLSGEPSQEYHAAAIFGSCRVPFLAVWTTI